MGLKDWLLRQGNKSPMVLTGGCADIQHWEDIYNGGGDWRYTRRGGIQGGTRRMASLGAAKALCGELARLCFTEGTAMCYSDKDTESFVNGVLRQSRFAERFPGFLEKVFALGGGVIKVYWNDGVKVDLVTAACFLPTAWDSRSITGGAFASRIVSGGRSYILAETQELDGSALVIRNRLYREDGASADMQEILPGLQEQSDFRSIPCRWVYPGGRRRTCGRVRHKFLRRYRHGSEESASGGVSLQIAESGGNNGALRLLSAGISGGGGKGLFRRRHYYRKREQIRNSHDGVEIPCGAQEILLC